MTEQSKVFKDHVDKVNFSSPNIPVINNVDVCIEDKENQIKKALVRQLYSSVRWVETIEYGAARC